MTPAPPCLGGLLISPILVTLDPSLLGVSFTFLLSVSPARIPPSLAPVPSAPRRAGTLGFGMGPCWRQLTWQSTLGWECHPELAVKPGSQFRLEVGWGGAEMAPTPEVGGEAACVGGWGRQGCQAGPAHKSFLAPQNPIAGDWGALEGLGVDSQAGAREVVRRHY